jgi:IS66 Orf2 like protein
MIPVPSGVRVWLAVGHTDMRRGMNGLALQVQEKLGRDPHAGDLYVFRGNAVTWSRFSGTTGSACRSTPSGSNGAGLSGRRRPMAQSQSPRRSSPICLMA